MDIKQVLHFSIGLFCMAFAMCMFFYFPGVEAWTFSALHPIASLRPVFVGASVWIDLLMSLLVVLPGLFGPLLILRARRFGRAKLIFACFALAALFIIASTGTPQLYGRAALIALLTGQLLALGLSAGVSVPFNWMVYMSYMTANTAFPDKHILAAANLIAGGYLLAAGLIVFLDARKRSGKSGGDKSGKKKSGYRVMVG